jgi:hypothetical protein
MGDLYNGDLNLENLLLLYQEKLRTNTLTRRERLLLLNLYITHYHEHTVQTQEWTDKEICRYLFMGWYVSSILSQVDHVDVG